jgi:hypothetical protein
MTFDTSNSAIRTRFLSWGCALVVLTITFGFARLAFSRLPIFALLAVAGFKYASMFYVAGRLIEQVWCYISKSAARCLVDASKDGPASSKESEVRQPRKHSLRSQMRQVRQAHVLNEKGSEVSHG